MWQSLKYSHLFLRFGLAAVFLWFGLDKFIHPNYWISAWVPESVIHLASIFHVSATGFIYGVGVFEMIAGISFLANMYVGVFGTLAIIFLVSMPFFQGFNEVIVRDIGLIGALLALVSWPRPRFR